MDQGKKRKTNNEAKTTKESIENASSLDPDSRITRCLRMRTCEQGGVSSRLIHLFILHSLLCGSGRKHNPTLVFVKYGPTLAIAKLLFISDAPQVDD